MAQMLMDALKKSIGKKKNKSQAFAWLADLERESGDLELSLERVDGGLTLYPNDVPAMLVRSMILFQKEDYEGCIAECEKALRFDPFCLSAQKRMGDAYDKLGNENERNKCYRRVHDMDPLDTFWKDEYDHIEETAVEAAATAASLSDIDFSMPDNGTADGSSAMALDTGLSSPDDGELTFAMPEQSAPMAPAGNASESANEFAMPESLSEGAETASAEDDPFAAFASLASNSDPAEDNIMESLQGSLESAMAEMANDEPSAPEVFPADDEVSGSDVGSALSDIFGSGDDELEPEMPVSPFAKIDLPTTLEDEPAAEESDAQKVFGNDVASEDKPQSVDSIFNDIFGEDEFPEEKPQPAVAPEEDKPQSIDSAFNDIFGEDELPEEKVQPSVDVSLEAPAAEELPASGEDSPLFEKSSEGSLFEKSSESSLFEKSADDDSLNMELDAPKAEEGGLFEKSASFDSGLDMADEKFDDLLSEPATIEPVEEPAAEESAAVETAAETSAAVETAAAGLELPAEDDSLNLEMETPKAEEGGLFEKSATFDSGLDMADEKLDDLLSEPATIEPVEEPAAEESAAVETAAETAAEPVAAELELPTEDDSLNVDLGLADETNEDLPSEKPVEEKSQGSSDMASEMGGAFDSLFGSDDDLDLPEEKKEEPKVVSEEDTGAAIEEAAMPDISLEDDLDKSFSSLFGEDDIASESIAEETKPMENTAKETVAEAPAAVETGSLESEVDGAFKGLFDMEDDSLPEEKPAGNMGVDFLMSGDSDDEVASGLLKDPSKPLERGTTDLDESLNTPTLAEIYFEQGLYEKALDIYEDLARKEPENEEIMKRMMEVEKVYREKFGGNANNG